MKYYLEPVGSVFEFLSSTEDGLHASFAEKRLSEEGKNELEHEKKKSLLARFLSQLLDPMVIVLIVAAVVSGVFKETADMVIILTVVLLNGVLGVFQEGKAEKAIEALQQMSSPFSRVRRDGVVRQIKSEEIVRGDVVLLEAGDSVPADMRLILTASLRLDEASLTGESVPVEKNPQTLPDTGSAIPLGDRLNMVYMGSNVVYGRGEGVVTRTGMDTEMGKIAGIITGAATEKTPLQKKLAQLSGVLSIGVLLICVFIFLFSVFKNGGFSGGHVLEMFMTAVSLAVAAIPEGLVAVVTILLSIGVTKMSRKNAIIRRLTAVETLGCTQIICSDKTGTLTQNKMKVVQSSGNEEKIAVSMCLCCDAQLAPDHTIVGEPTEAALVQFALDKGFDKNKLEEQMPRVGKRRLIRCAK